MTRAWWLLVLVGCGGDDGGGTALSCDKIPACYTSAVAEVRACFAAPTGTLSTPFNNSGSISGLTCTSGATTFDFADFSASPTGTVPLPSYVRIKVGGELCGVVSRGSGIYDIGEAVAYTELTVSTPTLTASVYEFENGHIGIACDDQVVETTPAELAACAGDVVAAQVVRNDDVTMMGIDEVDAAGARTSLVTCTP